MGSSQMTTLTLFDVGETAEVLAGPLKAEAERQIVAGHYLHSVPSGKTWYVRFGDAIVVWSIPANKNIGVYLLGHEANVWELARLWAPDGHEPNLLTKAIAAAVVALRRMERPHLLVSYADPNVGHMGGIYRAASWIYDGQTDETRTWTDSFGHRVGRRSMHSSKINLTHSEIEAAGWTRIAAEGKHRYVRPLSKRALREFLARRELRGT